MKVDWRYIIMVNGVLCAVIIGICMMHKLCAVNWAMGQLLCKLQSMDKAVDGFGLIM